MTVGGDRKSKAQNGLLIKGDTAETIAKEHNIGRNTVKREKTIGPKWTFCLRRYHQVFFKE